MHGFFNEDSKYILVIARPERLVPYQVRDKLRLWQSIERSVCLWIATVASLHRDDKVKKLTVNRSLERSL